MKTLGASSGNPFRAILDVGAALVSSLELDEVFANIAPKIGEAMRVWSVDVQTYDRERGTLLYEAYWSQDGPSDVDRAYIGTVTEIADRPEWQRVVDSREVVEWHVDDISLPPEERESMQKWGYKTTLDAPLMVGDEVIGALGVAEIRFVRRFTPAEITLFGQLRSLAAIAIHNAQVSRRQQEQNRRLSALLEVSRALTAGPVLADVCDAITSAAADVFAAPRAIIYEYDAEADTLTARSYFESDHVEGYDTTGIAEPVDAVVGQRSVLEGGGASVEHAKDDSLSDRWRTEVERWGEKTCLTVPLVARGETLGVLMLIWTDRERHLTPSELEFAGALGERAAIALHTARLLAASHGERSTGGVAG